MSINNYKIAVSDSKLEDLSKRLELTRLPEQLNNDDLWGVGTPLSEVQRLLKYWKNGFDWRKAEAQLNEMPQFMTKIGVDGFGELDIHFVHQVSDVKGAIPLLFSHGWPGSFIEVKKLLPLLKGDGKDIPAFHVVAPSLPNYGFSSGVTKKGFNRDQYGEVCHKLMLKLGYDKYVTQGGDWGYSVCRSISINYPSHNPASHVNVSLAFPPSFFSNPLIYLQNLLTSYSPFEKAGLARTADIDENGMGYNKLHSTKPQTIGYALEDSPIALLSWIYEKLHSWTDSYPWTDDEILTWISIYWFSTAGPAASVRIYYEATHPTPTTRATQTAVRSWVPNVKLGVGSFKNDLNIAPKLWTKSLGPLVWHSVNEKGGHFATWEVPEAVVRDLRGMFGRGGPCFGVVKGKDGY